MTPKSWSTPCENMFFLFIFSFVFPFMLEKDGKTCFSAKNIISTSKRHAEHPFAGQNTQHSKDCKINIGFVLLVSSYCFIITKQIFTKWNFYKNGLKLDLQVWLVLIECVPGFLAQACLPTCRFHGRKTFKGSFHQRTLIKLETVTKEPLGYKR